MGAKAITNDLPDNIKDVKSEITKQEIVCKECGKNYKIIQQELEFYKKNNIPVLDKCPDCRYKNRIKLRNPNKLWDRKCDKCNSDIRTSYSPDRPETVYCEKCYLKEVY